MSEQVLTPVQRQVRESDLFKSLEQEASRRIAEKFPHVNPEQSL